MKNPFRRSPAAPSAVDALLADDRPPRWWRRPLPWVLVLLVAGAVAGWQAWRTRSAQQAQPVYVTERIQRGDLTLTVSANGTLQPVRAVNIGSELSGTVREVLVDVNDRVR
ncbi:MAG: hypothetical protein P3W95_007910 [Tepidimonas taiwanensis]|nr:hypothetical protein [Tepidimonas taiwanensis]